MPEKQPISFYTIFTTCVAFLIGYGAIMIAAGYRYNLYFDWVALGNGFVTAGLYHLPSNTNPLASKDK